MTLVDAGPLIALVDRGQGEAHRRCTEVLKSLTGPLLTTWSCLTEAMYFLGELRGWSGQQALWRFIERGALLVHSSTEGEKKRMRVLMEEYRDVPMNLADASLVATAEARHLVLVFTLDADFHIYRLNRKDAFEVIP